MPMATLSILILVSVWISPSAIRSAATEPARTEMARDVRDVGGPAPKIDLQQVLQAPQGTDASLKGLHGKVVVLEFWATWCSNCVKAIPHFNELADSLKGEPVQFIAVTDEDEKTVRAFLTSHPIHGWVGLNTTGSMIRSYGIHTGNDRMDAERPLTVVIRPDGIVDARLRPWVVPFPMTAKKLIDLAHGKPSGLASSRIIFAGEVRDPSGKPVVDAAVRARETAGDGSWTQIGYEAVTDHGGHFTIDVEYPLSDFSAHPVILTVTRPGYFAGRLDDLRPLSAAEQRTLHVTLRRLSNPR